MSVRSGTGTQVCMMPNLCVALPLSLLLQLYTSPDLGYDRHSPSRPFFLLLEFRTTGKLGEGENEGREWAPGGSAPHDPRQVPTLTGSQSSNFVFPLGTSLCCYEDQRERRMCKVEHPVLEFCSFSVLSTPEWWAVNQKVQPHPGVGKAQGLRAQTLQPDCLH